VAVTGHITVAGVVNVAEIVAWNLGHLRFSDIINSFICFIKARQNHSSIAYTFVR
jgi:hypothetical protein